tara:strand:+ start:112 stop:579 length:468 start_codon:yes stop_codon:yes gene_type:complete
MIKNSLKHFARLAAVQALYQVEVNGQNSEFVVQEFKRYRLKEFVIGKEEMVVDEALFSEIVTNVGREVCRLDERVQKVLAGGWKISRLDPTSRALLRAACYELDQKSPVPARVIIKEYVDISGNFSGKTETAFVNAALDALAREIRCNEMLQEHS